MGSSPVDPDLLPLRIAGPESPLLRLVIHELDKQNSKVLVCTYVHRCSANCRRGFIPARRMTRCPVHSCNFSHGKTTYQIVPYVCRSAAPFASLNSYRGLECEAICAGVPGIASEVL